MNKGFIFLIVITSSLFAAKIDLDTDIKNIPAKIQNIRCIGKWKNKTDQGYYRIIHIESFNGCSLLYVQWMKELTSSDFNQRVLYTLSFKEFNADDHIELTFPFPKFKIINKQLILYVDAISGNDDKNYQYKITLHNKLGQYTIEKI